MPKRMITRTLDSLSSQRWGVVCAAATVTFGAGLVTAPANGARAFAVISSSCGPHLAP